MFKILSAQSTRLVDSFSLSLQSLIIKVQTLQGLRLNGDRQELEKEIVRVFDTSMKALPVADQLRCMVFFQGSSPVSFESHPLKKHVSRYQTDVKSLVLGNEELLNYIIRFRPDTPSLGAIFEQASHEDVVGMIESCKNDRTDAQNQALMYVVGMWVSGQTESQSEAVKVVVNALNRTFKPSWLQSMMFSLDYNELMVFSKHRNCLSVPIRELYLQVKYAESEYLSGFDLDFTKEKALGSFLETLKTKELSSLFTGKQRGLDREDQRLIHLAYQKRVIEELEVFGLGIKKLSFNEQLDLLVGIGICERLGKASGYTNLERDLIKITVNDQLRRAKQSSGPTCSIQANYSTQADRFGVYSPPAIFA